MIVFNVQATAAFAETIDVKYRGRLDLAPFACSDVTRGSFIARVCYDRANQYMIVRSRVLAKGRPLSIEA